MFRRALSLAAVVAALSASPALAESAKLFKPGSLIIPQSAVFQNGCGAVSAYGLIYRLLLENQSTGVFGATPVTIYWSIDPQKKSLNRCVPTNKHTAPTSSPGLWTTDWNDGCDFTVGPSTTAGQQPVVQVDFSKAVPTATPPLYVGSPYSTSVTTYATTSNATPGFAAVTLPGTGTGVNAFTTARYEGGPFLIDVSDAKRVLDYLKTNANAADFRTACSTSCDGNAYTATIADKCHLVNIHQNLVEFTAPVYRRITNVPPHIAVLTTGPGVSGDMLPKYMASANLDFAGAIGCPPNHAAQVTGGLGLTGCPTGVSGSGIIYDRFVALDDLRDLTAAEATALDNGTTHPALVGGILNSVDVNDVYRYQVLWTPHWEISQSFVSQAFTTCQDVRDAVYQACRAGGQGQGNGCGRRNRNCGNNGNTGSSGGSQSDCADVADAAKSECGNTGSTILSTQGCTSSPCNASSGGTASTGAKSSSKFSGLSTNIKNAMLNAIASNFPTPTTLAIDKINGALANITAFTNRSGTGLFAECASVSTFETAFKLNSSKYEWVEPKPDNAPEYASVPRFMYDNGIEINGLAPGTTRNCTDPDYTSSSGDCIIYPVPGNPFSQMGDFRFQSVSAHTVDWIPMKATSTSDWNTPSDPQTLRSGWTTTASSLRNGGLILARSWTAFAGTSDAQAVTGQPSWQYVTDTNKHNGWTFFSLMQKDNDPDKALILYLGGHEYSNSPAGTRVALNTLLNLGSDPILADRALTAPVAFDDTNGSSTNGDRAIVLSSTYKSIGGVIPPGAEVYNPATGSQWIFPYTRGDLRAHKLESTGALVTGSQDLSDGQLWSADVRLPKPAKRNIFTYVGGKLSNTLANGATGVGAQVCTSTGCSPDTSASTYVPPNGLLQTGWRAVAVSPSAVVAPSSGTVTGCVDVVTTSFVNDLTDNTSKLGFAPGADGVCDLQELMQYTQLNPTSGTGGGSGGGGGTGGGGGSSAAPNSTDITNLTTDLPNVKHILAMVRGNCYATPTKADGVDSSSTVYEDSTQFYISAADCNSGLASGSSSTAPVSKQSNLAHMGGLVRSTPAVVPPSSNVPVSCSTPGCKRPTVAYVGSYDGMVHAVYISGGTNYTRPSNTLHYPNPPAVSVFADAPSVSGSGGWTPPSKGTELWAFMPSSQLPFLAYNAANVDSSMLVQDVFADFVGTGKREWHTVLVGSAGADSREVFALDITDPLNPVLLWDVVGSTRRTGTTTPTMASVATLADGQDPSSLTHYTVNKWDGASTSTDYKLPPATASGRAASKAYDYSDLGGTNSLSMGLLRVGLNPVYAVFVAASASALQNTPTKGLEVFAIDVATGQKLWQWERGYDESDTTMPHDNYSPRGVTLYYGTEGATTVLVGDFDGKLWQLDASTGVNRNYMSSNCVGDCNLPAFSTGSTGANPQPITSNIALAKLPSTGITGDFASFGGQTLLLFGTAGASSVGSDISGAVHSLILGTQYRKPLTACTSCTSAVSGTTWSDIAAVVASAQSTGVLEEPSTWPKSLPTGERVFGFLTVAGTTVFVPSVTGQVAIEDLMHIDPETAGSTYTINLATVTDSSLSSTNALSSAFSKANFGGVAVYSWPPDSSGKVKQTVVGAEVSSLVRYDTDLHNPGTNAMDPNSKLKTNSGDTGVGYRLLNWFRKFAK